jgi:hypothetical protein
VSQVDPLKFEALARGVALGMTIMSAGLAAGYTGKCNGAYRVAAQQKFKDRVAQLRAELAWCGWRDIEALLRALKLAYDGAMQKRMFDAAGRIVMQAARLQKELPRRPIVRAGAAEPHPWDRFAPK